MKMKAIFLLLNAVLGVAFLVIFLTPLFLVGGDWFSLFWTRNWPIAVIFVLTLVRRRRLFPPELEAVQRPGKGELGRSGRVPGEADIQARMDYRPAGQAASQYLSRHVEHQGILALEAYLAGKKPVLIPRFSLPFGIPHLLGTEPKDAEAWFRGMLGRPRLADRDWVSWNHAFSLLQTRRGDEARAELSALIDRVSDPVLLLLTMYLLDVLARDDAALESRVAAKRDI